MMWNWLVSGLAVGATLVCYDGHPFYPAPEALLKMADELGITIFGTSAKYIATLKDVGVVPNKISWFPNLKLITSTGSTIFEESFDYVYEHWKSDVQLSSISGGTDLKACFAKAAIESAICIKIAPVGKFRLGWQPFSENGNSLF